LALPLHRVGTAPKGVPMSDVNTTYLSKFQSTLNDVFKPDLQAPLHVCFEAAHPWTFGRPADLIMQVLLGEPFLRTGDASSPHVHFVPDRLSVPRLDGHVLAVGGPRSNVVSRIVMEYDVDFEIAKPYYRRRPGAYFPMEYTHIHRYDFDDRLLADMNALDQDGRAILHYYYGLIQKNDERGIKLFSVNRHFHRREYGNLPSLSFRPAEGPPDETIIYDHFVETILPNVFSKDWQHTVIVIVHGLRLLGTFAGLYCLSQPEYLAGLRQRLQIFRVWFPSATRKPVTIQTVRRVLS
jgi:hypothetical protein